MVQATCNPLGVERIILQVFSHREKEKTHINDLPINVPIPLKYFISSEIIYLRILNDYTCSKILLKSMVLVITTMAIQGKIRHSVTQVKFSFSYAWE